jgi:hypothetical protein
MTPEIQEEFLARVACGERFKTIFADPHMPTLATVAEYLESEGPEPEAFRAAYDRAWRFRGDRWAEEMIEIADDCLPRRDDIARAKLRIQARRRLLEVLRPDVFGRPKKVQAEEKAPQTVTVIQVPWSDLSEEERGPYDARYPGVAPATR